MADVMIEQDTTFGITNAYQPGDGDLVVVDENRMFWFRFETLTLGPQYYYTDNGGTTWTGPISFPDVGTPYRFGIWYDKWTLGDIGTKIHLVFDDTIDDTLHHVTLDVVTRAQSAVHTIADLPSNEVGESQGPWAYIRVCKAIGGMLYAVWWQMDANFPVAKAFYSEDDGDTWSAGGTIGITDTEIQELNQIVMTPSEVSEFVWLVRHGYTLGGVGYLKADLLFNGTGYINDFRLIEPANDFANIDTGFSLSAVTLQETGRMVVAIPDRTPGAVAQVIRCYSVAALASQFVREADIESVAGATEDVRSVSLFCDQNSGHLYCSYLYGDSPNSLNPYYRRSLNGGYSWQSRVKFDAAAGSTFDHVSGPRGSERGIVSLYALVWYMSTDPEEYWTKDGNLELGKYTVRDGDSGQEIVACPTGMAMGAGDSNPQFVQERYPHPDFQPDRPAAGFHLLHYDEYSGSHNAGDTIEGAISGTVAKIAGFLTDRNMIIIYEVQIGRQGGLSVFRAGETVNNLTTGGDFTLIENVASVSQAGYGADEAFAESL